MAEPKATKKRPAPPKPRPVPSDEQSQVFALLRKRMAYKARMTGHSLEDTRIHFQKCTPKNAKRPGEPPAKLNYEIFKIALRRLELDLDPQQVDLITSSLDVKGTGFVDPDVKGDARFVGFVDRRQGGAPVDGGEPAVVAMGEDVEGICGGDGGGGGRARVDEGLEESEAVGPDGLAGGDVFVADGDGFKARASRPALARFAAHDARDPFEGPAEIDGGGSRSEQSAFIANQCFVARVLL